MAALALDPQRRLLYVLVEGREKHRVYEIYVGESAEAHGVVRDIYEVPA